MSILADIGLESYGFTPQQVTQMEAAKDDLQHIYYTYLAIKPRIDRVLPIFEMIAGVVSKKELQTPST